MRLIKCQLRLFASKKKKDSTLKVSLSQQQIKSLALFKSQQIPPPLSKVLPSLKSKNTLITAALPYVNNVPHLGNIIGALLSADVVARFKRLIGQNVLFICGTDEYGTATEVKAKQSNTTPLQICTHYHNIHKKIYQWFNISYNHFGRTSSPVHAQVVQDIFLRCYENDFFIQKEMKQLYCSSCAMFLADRFVVGKCKTCHAVTKADQCDSCNKVFQAPESDLYNIKCSICSATPSVQSTTHLFSNFESNPGLKEALNQWLFSNNLIESWSNNAKGETKFWLKDNLKDRCMTRDLKWGVPVPLQKFNNKVFYVWFDAPIGYISITKDLLGQDYQKWWKKSDQFDVELIQFMGKDNIMFHSILFPSTLISATIDKKTSSYNLVNKLCVTEYLCYEGGKFSKSGNRGVFGTDCQKTQIQPDVWRYYLLSNRPENYDCEFSWHQFTEKNNKELMNSIGNLYNRILKVAIKDFNGSVPPLNMDEIGQTEETLLSDFKGKVSKYIKHLQNSEIKNGAETLLEISFLLNKYVQETQFWKNKERKNLIVSFVLRNLCVYGHLLEPYVPQTSARIYYMLGMESWYQARAIKQIEQNFVEFMKVCLQRSTGLKEPLLLFTQISLEKIQALREQYGSSVKDGQRSEVKNKV